MQLVYKSYILSKNFKWFFFSNLSLLILIGKNGFLKLKFPSVYFQKNNYFIFINKFYYKSILNLFVVNYNKLFHYYFFKLKIRGLGFRIKRLYKFLYRIFLIFVNYIYLHLPKSILLKTKGKEIFFFSYDFSVLRNMACKMLLLRSFNVYKRRGLFVYKQIYFRKPGKKKF